MERRLFSFNVQLTAASQLVNYSASSLGKHFFFSLLWLNGILKKVGNLWKQTNNNKDLHRTTQVINLTVVYCNLRNSWCNTDITLSMFSVYNLFLNDEYSLHISLLTSVFRKHFNSVSKQSLYVNQHLSTSNLDPGTTRPLIEQGQCMWWRKEFSPSLWQGQCVMYGANTMNSGVTHICNHELSSILAETCSTTENQTEGWGCNASSMQKEKNIRLSRNSSVHRHFDHGAQQQTPVCEHIFISALVTLPAVNRLMKLWPASGPSAHSGESSDGHERERIHITVCTRINEYRPISSTSLQRAV